MPLTDPSFPAVAVARLRPASPQIMLTLIPSVSAITPHSRRCLTSTPSHRPETRSRRARYELRTAVPEALRNETTHGATSAFGSTSAWSPPWVMIGCGHPCSRALGSCGNRAVASSGAVDACQLSRCTRRSRRVRPRACRSAGAQTSRSLLPVRELLLDLSQTSSRALTAMGGDGRSERPLRSTVRLQGLIVSIS